MLVRSDSVAGVDRSQPDRQWLLKRNSALSPRQLVTFYFSLVAVALMIAVGLAISGAWMVLPFSGLELLGLGAALWIYQLRMADYERVSLRGNELIVEVVQGGRQDVYPLNRYWVRLERATGASRRLVLSQHGRQFTLGRFLGDEERHQFEQELRSALAEDKARQSWT